MNTNVEEESFLKDRIQKAKDLEAQLLGVTAASTSVSRAYHDIRNELQGENVFLRERVKFLTNKILEHEKIIECLGEDNKKLKSDAGMITNKLNDLNRVLDEMKHQKETIMKEAGLWEESLQVAWNVDGKESEVPARLTAS